MSNEEQTLLDAVRDYITDARTISQALKEVGLRDNNVPLIMIQQGSLDTISDIEHVLVGHHVMSLKEMQKKANETKDNQDYLR